MRHYLKELAIWTLLGGITAGGVYLVQQNQALAHENRVLARRAVEPRAGLFVPAYAAATLDGQPVALGALGHRQVLIFFRTTCPYCRASTPAWNTIAERLRTQPAIAVYGVAMDSVGAARTYAAEYRLRFSVIARPDPRLVSLYRVSSVPMLLVVNEQGRLAYARLGVLQSAAAVDSVVTAAEAPPPSLKGAPERASTPARGRIEPH
jgi:peroxiredoxin